MNLAFGRLTAVSALLMMFCILPRTSSAQCYFDIAVYAAGDYENIDEDNVTLYGWGSAIDYSPCQDVCLHVWGGELEFIRVPDQVTAASYSFPDMPNPGAVDAGTNTVPGEYIAKFKYYVGCYCSYQVAEQSAQQSVSAPSCKYPQIARRGVLPGTIYRYFNDGGGGGVALDGEQFEGVYQAANRWTSANYTTGLNTSFSEVEETGRILRVHRGDPGTIDGDGLYASTAISRVDNYSFSANTIMNSDPAQVFGTPGYRRIYLHELGHFHGLDHASTQPRSTVMRTPLGPSGSYLPDSPTSCDRSQAYSAGYQ